jgi:hypothetical protein
MTKEELDFIGSMNMCDEISNDAYEKIVNHIEETEISDDCVSRASVKELFQEGCVMGVYDFLGIDDLPPVTPTHGTCKDCKHYYMDEDGHGCHCEKFDYTRFPVYADFYCASFEKRGNSDGSN